MASHSLRERSATFADEIQRTVSAVLPGQIAFRSTAAPAGEDRFIVAPEVGRDGLPGSARIPLFVADERLAELTAVIYLGMDAVDQHLKAVRMDLAVHSTLDRKPLVRLDYRTDMHSDPIAHWQMHAERGAFSHLLARAHAVRPKVVANPHDLSSVHLPVGGERFRPCLEDFLQFLVEECGVDSLPGWHEAVVAGREQFRRRQARTIVRDAQEEAAKELRAHGWTVTPPPTPPGENFRVFTTW